MTTRQAAEYLGYAEDTVRKYVYRGLIKTKKFGGLHVLTKQECDRFRKERRPIGRPRAS